METTFATVGITQFFRKPATTHANAAAGVVTRSSKFELV